MLANNYSSPDKPRGFLIVLLVRIVRSCRRNLLIIKSKNKIKFGNNSYIGKRADIYVPVSSKIGDNV